MRLRGFMFSRIFLFTTITPCVILISYIRVMTVQKDAMVIKEIIVDSKWNQTLRPHPDNKFVSSDWLLLEDKSSYERYLMGVCAKEKHHNVQHCECVPGGLDGRIKVSLHKVSSLTWEKISEVTGLQPGGHWVPDDCITRRRVAIIIPFLDRKVHLKYFLHHNVPIWKKQKVEFRIFVAEQNQPETFNKGKLMNAGFLEARKLYDFDCVVFHDVDLLMETGNNILHCGERVVHYGAYVSTLHYRLLYFPMFGGAVCITPAQYRAINGYSNRLPGWGGEDDEFFNRVNNTGLGWVRPGQQIARFRMIRHVRDKRNPVAKIRWLNDAKSGI